MCADKINKYVGRSGDRIRSHRKKSAGYIFRTLRYEVLKKVKSRCELCGISAQEKALEVDHIIPRNFNGAEQEGCGFYQLTQKDGARWSTAAAYLRAAMDRPNLTVVTNALTTKVNFEGRRAVGINYIHQGQVVKKIGMHSQMIAQFFH